MADFNIRSDSVDVEQIMTQIRTRISEKRDVDYTEAQIQELATVRLEKFLDPKNLRSDLLEQFRKSRPALPQPPVEPGTPEPPYVFDDSTLFQSHRGPLRFIRKLLRPLLKLFFNPNTLNQVLHTQAQFNLDILKRDLRRRYEFQQQVYSFDRSRGEWNLLYYEVLHNLVLETTRNGIELKNMKMRLEALASRLDFSERRVRALEGVVQYRPEVLRPRGRDRDRDRDRDRPSGRAVESVEDSGDGELDATPRPGANVSGLPLSPSLQRSVVASPEAAQPRRAEMGAASADAGRELQVRDGGLSLQPRPDVQLGEDNGLSGAVAPGSPGPGMSSPSDGRRRRRRRRGRRGPGAPQEQDALPEQNASPEGSGSAVTDSDVGDGDDRHDDVSSADPGGALPDPDRQ